MGAKDHQFSKELLGASEKVVPFENREKKEKKKKGLS